MRHRSLKLGLAVATALAAVLPLGLFVQAASADYAPAQKDVVGVGSDTLQYMLDFLADGDGYGNPGYNAAGGKYKLVSFDATADANARLAYGVNGGIGDDNGASGSCTPGTGSTAGTGNATSNGTGELPCVLNPTIVLRAETQPVQRPNGSGAGFSALVQDIVAGNNGLTPTTPETISFARASAAQTTSAIGSGAPVGIDQLSVGQDTLPIIVLSSTITPTNAVPLDTAQLELIYSQNQGSCITWNNPAIGGTSPDAIVPLIPQVGSGTRKYFLQTIQGTTGTPANPGTCAVTVEENDPTAIAAQTSAQDAIEPISQGRLDLFLGTTEDGRNPFGAGVGYFLDPSCVYDAGTSACGTGTVSAGTYLTNPVNPPVKVLTGTPLGTDGGSGTTAFDPTRTLYLYFRSIDPTSTTGWQPGTVENWVNDLFWNPCTTADQTAGTCSGPTGSPNTWGPGGAPFIEKGAGQLLLEDAGIIPLGNNEACFEITVSQTTPCPAG